MIQLPIEIGDIVLGGRFKNKKIVVREIGLDDYQLPTINGRGILKIRVPKLYKKENENVKGNDMKLKENDTKCNTKGIKPFEKLPLEVKVKEEDGRWKLYLQTTEGETCLTPVGFETKELASHAALTKGLTLKGNEPNETPKIETPPPTKPEPSRKVEVDTVELGKEKEIKMKESTIKVLKGLVKEIMQEIAVKKNSMK